MIEIRSNVKTKKYNKSVPSISFKDEDIMMELDNLINTDKNIYEYMGLLLLKLRFKSEDSILFDEYDKVDSSFLCIVNDTNSVRIKFSDKEIIVSNCNREYGYTYVPCDKKELGVDVNLNRSSVKYDDGLLLTRYYSRDCVRYISVVDNNQLEVKVDKPLDLKLPLYDDNGRYAQYKLENEDKLVNYLRQFNGDVKLSSVYEYICNNCIDDMSKYPFVSLTLSLFDNNYNVTKMNVVSFLYGEIDRFGLVDDKRTVFIEKDGSYVYEINNDTETPKLVINYSEKTKMYNISYMVDASKTTKYSNNLLVVDSAIEDVKKLTKSLFTKKR